MAQAKLFMVLLGSTPAGRNTEQHDIFFGIAGSIKDLVPEILDFWPEAGGKVHIDAWREVNYLGGYSIQVVSRTSGTPKGESLPKTNKLFFINLGGYKEEEFDEFHYKFLVVAQDKAIATQQAKETAFYKHVGFNGASSHIDDKYGIDIDDIHEIHDILSEPMKAKYSLIAEWTGSSEQDALNLGYFRLDKLD
jgi:hypothetical protein